MRCYSHLSDDEREQIGLGKALGHSIGAIAQAIGRPKSTISRELSRNKLPSGRYSPLHAAGAYQLRRRREALIEGDRALRTFVVKGGAPNKLAPDSRQGSSPSSPSPTQGRRSDSHSPRPQRPVPRRDRIGCPTSSRA